jgi:hypothetical protein
MTIRTNNPANAVPDDAAVWVDADPQSDRRSIFFFGRRFPRQASDADARQDQCSLFTTAGCPAATLQVWVRGYKNHYVYIRLFGESLSLNAPGLPPYQLKHNLLVPTTWDPPKIIAEVLKRAPLTHLVINAHGGAAPDPMGPSQTKATVFLGTPGFNYTNVGIWTALRDKVKYIWLMNCVTGSQNYLCGMIAKNTGAWVSAATSATGYKPQSLPNEHVEYFESPPIKHWNGSIIDAKDTTLDPHKADDFFLAARYRPEPSLGESALYFNVVSLGAVLGAAHT